MNNGSLGTKVLIVGAGVTGLAVARAVCGSTTGRQATLADDSARPRPGGLDDGVAFVAPVTDWHALVTEADLVVVSPGVTPQHPIFAAATDRAVELIGEIEFALRVWEERFGLDRTSMALVAVTGTNGKTTVTTLIDEMLRASGVDSRPAGNIGTALIDVVSAPETTADTAVVLEASSFQLATTARLAPRVAVITNIAADHYDWHADLADYAAAKARIVTGQSPDDLVVYPSEDSVVLGMVQESPAQRFGFSRRAGDVVGGPAAGVEWVDSDLLLDGTPVMTVDEIARQTPIDRVNLVAAGTAAWHMGGTVDGITQTAASFTGLAHRVALVAHVDQVRWIDDSKATNPHAAVNAIATFDSVVLIAGGRNKGLDLGVLADEGSRIRALVGIGEASPEVEAVAAALGKPFRAADSMDAAVKAAAALAKAGDTVLLSPACASFDWYRSYAERGNDFERAVQTWLLQPSPRGPEPGIASLEER